MVTLTGMNTITAIITAGLNTMGTLMVATITTTIMIMTRSSTVLKCMTDDTTRRRGRGGV
jgi:hypothetical protein